MKPMTVTEVANIRFLLKQGWCVKRIAGRVGRSTNAVHRVRRGLVLGKRPKISGMDKVDIHAWWKAVRSLPTMAQIARKFKVSQQYIRDICYEMDRQENIDLKRNAA